MWVCARGGGAVLVLNEVDELVVRGMKVVRPNARCVVWGGLGWRARVADEKAERSEGGFGEGTALERIGYAWCCVMW